MEDPTALAGDVHGAFLYRLSAARMPEGYCWPLTHTAHAGDRQTDRQTDALLGRRYLNLEADLQISANVNTPQHML